MDDLEERLRDDLRRSASREEPSVDAWDRITERVQRGERRSTASRALVGALVLAITAGGLFWLWRGFVATDGGPPTGQPEDLWGRTFVSTRVTEEGEPHTLVEDTRIELTFFEERGERGVGWSAGCNTIGAKIEVTTERLLLGEIGGTQQACAPESQDQDEWLVDFFRSEPRWEFHDDTLTLTSGDTMIELSAITSWNGLDCLGDEGAVEVIYESFEPAGAELSEAVEAAFQLPPAVADAQQTITRAPDGETAEVLYRFEERSVARVSFARVEGGWAISDYRACDSAAPGS